MWLPLECPLLGAGPATQACALTGNGTCDLLVRRPVLSPVSYTSQGCFLFFLLNILFYYSCPNFSPFALLCPAHPSHPTVIPYPVVHVHGSFRHVPSPSFRHYPSPPSLLVTLSLFSFPYLWFCFARLLILFISIL